MSIDTYLARHGATTTPRPKRTAADRVLAEIAAHAVVSRDAEQLLRTVERSLGNDAETLSIKLEERFGSASPVSVVARRLTNIGVLSFVRTSGGDEPSLTAMISKLCSDRVRERVKWLVQNGRWLELGSAELVRQAAENAGGQVEVATRVLVTRTDGTVREVDVFVCTADEALLIECKSGFLGIDGVGRYGELAESLGIPRSHPLVLALALDALAIGDVMAFHPVTVVRRDHLESAIVKRLDKMLAQPGVEPIASASTPLAQTAAAESQPVEGKAPALATPPDPKPVAKMAAAKQKPVVKQGPEKVAAKPKPGAKKQAPEKVAAKPKPDAKKKAPGKATPKKATPKKAASKAKPVAKKSASKKAAPPLRRNVVAPELIESALIAAANAASPPANLGQLVNVVREDLWCTINAAKAAARTLLAEQRFLNKRNEVVGDFSTPIHAVRTANSDLTPPNQIEV